MKMGGGGMLKIVCLQINVKKVLEEEGERNLVGIIVLRGNLSFFSYAPVDN